MGISDVPSFSGARLFFNVVGLLAMLFGGGVLLFAKSTIHETTALLALLICVVSFSTVAILGAIRQAIIHLRR